SRRVAALAADREAVLPGSSPATTRRDHSFTGVPLGAEPTQEELLALVERRDEVNELQRLKIIELYDLLEVAVTERVAAERRAGELPAIAPSGGDGPEQYPIFI